MKPTIQLKLQPNLSLSLGMQHAIRLLQLSSQELEVELQTQLEKNPLLEIEEDKDAKNDLGAELSEWLTEASKENHLNSTQQDKIINIKAEYSLQQYLLWQMEFSNFTEIQRKIAITLIDAISDQGYLQGNLLDIQQSLAEQGLKNLSIQELETVLYTIQQFDPLSVGARDLKECLEIQLKALPQNTPHLEITQKIVQNQNYLELLARKDCEKLRKKLKIAATHFKLALKTLKSLNPKPGSKISSRRSEIIFPDVILRKKNTELVVELNMNTIPKLKMHPQSSAWLKRAHSPQDLRFLKDHHREAKWLMNSLKVRNETLLTVSKCIVEKQKDFFEKGDLALQPLNLSEIAKSTGLHESTVSRITTHKYIFTPKGVFELKYFFSKALDSQTGKSYSTKTVRSFIKQFIAEEKPQQPLSDDKITALLLEQGIKVARRTVSKYRKSLKIASASERRRVHVI